jgi:alpha-galactosidase
VIDLATGTPTIRHWGARLSDDFDLDSLVLATTRPIAHGGLDVESPLSLVPEHATGFPGHPALLGHRRRGTAWAPRFAYEAHTLTDANTLTAIAVDHVAQLRITSVISLGDVLSVRLTVTNLSTTDRYLLDQLDVTLPLPAQAREIMQFSGRWTRELHPYRASFERGAIVAENRRGRTSHEHLPLVFAGETSFGEWRGEVWGAHLAWSGNHHLLAEVLPDGRRYLQMGELFHPGEIALAAGASYTTPELIATYSSSGLTQASWGLHRSVRAQPSHPSSPRPVLLNTWEAVYFEHDSERLKRLAEAAAAVGIERFVLDDGWFGSRRDDRRGLGDWWVSPEVYPDGLTPLIDHVRALGMQFGIWVEPEMVNPDSELFRAHPEWALATEGYEPVLGRQQLVLNLAHPPAYEHILDALDALLRDHDIAYVKWDMNRDHVQGGGTDHAAGTHAQTMALYRLLDELRSRHPAVEFESCASGGGRIDHEILRRTQRVWTSDCNDALERQAIQRGASMFIPPEVMGAHIGPTRSHTTGRRHSLSFRVATAMFGHLGVEWNLLELTDTEREGLADAIAVHKRFRHLLHHGDVVRFDPTSAAAHAHGVYSADRTEALIAYVQLSSDASLTPPPIRLPGLTSHARYLVERVPLPHDRTERGPARAQPHWLRDGISLSGEHLGAVGLQLPVMNPESALLISLRTV